MSANSYDKAVEGFEALLSASANATHAKPAHLIEDSGHHATSGYRHTAALEAAGFLRRDESGVYLQGAAALRIGLGAFGFGQLAPVLPPVLRRMREETGHTSFLALLSGNDVHLGPYSVGRATRNIALSATFRQDARREFSDTRPLEIGLVPQDDGTGKRLYSLMLPVAQKGGCAATLGFVLIPARAPEAALNKALRHAARRITA